MENPNTVVGTFANPATVERTIAEIQAAGLPYKRISVLAKEEHTEDHAAGYCIPDGRMRYWGGESAFWDSLWGILTGAGVFWAPEIGSVLIAGPLVALTAGALESNSGMSSLGAIGAGLYTLGLSKIRIVACENALKRGRYILVFMGSAEETELCGRILETARVLEAPAGESRRLVGV